MSDISSAISGFITKVTDRQSINYWLPGTLEEDADGTEAMRARFLISFVQNFRSKVDRVIVQNISDLGRRLDVPVIAEGIESEAQLEFLRSVEGCRLGQGYHLSRPQPIEEFLEHRQMGSEGAAPLFSANQDPAPEDGMPSGDGGV